MGGELCHAMWWLDNRRRGFAKIASRSGYCFCLPAHCFKLYRVTVMVAAPTKKEGNLLTESASRASANP